MTNQNKPNAVTKAKKSLMRSQIRAIIILGAVLVIAAIICGAVLFAVRQDIDVYTEVISFGEGGNNETYSYYSREKDGKFFLVGEDGEEIPSFTYQDSKICYETKKGTILTIDKAGKISVIAIFDSSDGEQINTSNTALLLYPRLERSEISSIEAVNDKGGYKIYAKTVDGNRRFLIQGYESSPIDQITLAAITTRCGIFSAQVKLDRETMKAEDEKHAGDVGYTPILNADGSVNLSIFGLESTYEVINEKGEKETKTTPYFIIRDIAGNAHKVIIGNQTTDGNHYYVRYENVNSVLASQATLDAYEKISKNVYLIPKDPTISTGYSSDVEVTILAGKAEICAPKIVETITTGNYYNVTNFTIAKLASGGIYNDVICISYSDLSERIGTIRQDIVYRFEKAEELGLVGYEPDNDRIFAALFAMSDISSAENPDIMGSADTTGTAKNYVKTVALISPKVNDLTLITEEMLKNDPEVRESVLALNKYGLLEAEYILSYDSPASGSASLMHQAVFISKKTTANTYYVWSPVYNQVVEIGAQYLDFISWDAFEWVDRDLFHTPITFCDGLKFTSGGEEFLFELDQEVTVCTKYSLPSNLSAVNITGGSYDVDITVDDRGNRTLKVSITAKYGDSYTHVDDFFTYSLDAIRNYCKMQAGDDITGLTADDIAKANAFGATVRSKSTANGILVLYCDAVFEGDSQQVFPSLKMELIFTYKDGNLTASVRPNYASMPSAVGIYDDKVFSDYFAYYLNDGNKKTELSEKELLSVKAYFAYVSRINTKETGVTVRINGGAPQAVDMKQFKELYADLIRVSFYGRADRSDVAGGKILSTEDMEAFKAKGDDCTMKVEFLRSVDSDLVFRMHDYSATKSYTTINGSGCFYINIAARKALFNSAKTVANGGDIINN